MKGLVILAVAALTIGLSAPADAATTYTYDTLGRVSTVTYDNGMVITYSYDPAGNRTTVATAP